MDVDVEGVSLEDLMAQLTTAQETKSEARLSERNVVELVQKLKEKGLIGAEENNALLHTVTGREYLTERKLRGEVKDQVDKLGGRVALAELPPLLDVDIVHCEKAARLLAGEARATGEIKLIDGELLTQRYFDDTGVEINETLQQRGHVTIGEMAKAYDLSADLMTRTVESKVGGVIEGEIRSGLVYTPTYISRVRAIVRGVLRGARSPVSLKAACSRLRVHEVALQALVPTLVAELVSRGEVSGTYQTGSSIWTPGSYGKRQEEEALSFFKANGYVEYETLKRLGIQKPQAYLRERYQEDFALETIFASPSVLPPLDAAVDDCISTGSYLDMGQHLPSPFTTGDVQDIVKLAPKVKQVVSSGAALVLAETCLVSKAFCEKCEAAVRESVVGRAREMLEKKKAAQAGDSKAAGAAKGKKGKGASGEAAFAAEDDSDDDWDTGRGKKGKKGKRGKGGGRGKKGGGGAAASKGQPPQDEAGAPPSLTELEGYLRAVDDELEYAGDEVTLLSALSSHFAHFAHNEHKEALKQNLKADAEARRLRSEALSSSVVARAHKLSVYSRSLSMLLSELEDEEESGKDTRGQLERHLVRAVVLPQVDDILKLSALQAFSIGQDLGEEIDELSKGKAGLTDKQRLTLARGLPKDISKAATDLASGIQKKTLQEALALAEDASSDLCGKRIPKLDKKMEQQIIQSYQNELLATLNSNQTLTSTIAIAVPLIFAKKKGCMLNLPGKLLSFALEILEGVLDQEDFELVRRLHKKTVELIQKSSKKGADDDEISSLEVELASLSSSVTDLVSKLCIEE